MVIEFDPEIFMSAENYEKIMLLFRLFANDRRHDVFIDITEVQDSVVFAMLPEPDKKAIEEYFNFLMTQAITSDYGISLVSVKDSTSLGLDDAITFFNQKVSIILENSFYDKPFLKAIADNFKKRAKKINKHWANKWIAIENGGGCENISNVIKGKLQEFENLTHDPEFYLRCFVLIDSDSLYPGHEKESRVELKKFLHAHRIPFHILTKREMENYLPEEVYIDLDDNNGFIAAFLRLSAVQKDYFDIQYGFVKKLNEYPTDVQDLYGEVSEGDMQIFRNHKFELPNFKRDFPDLFNSEKVTQDTLKKRVANQSNPNELEDILDKINKLL